MYRIFLAIAISAMPIHALANLPLDCIKAINLGRADEVERLAEAIKGQGEDYSSIARENASECLEAATGTYHRYDPKSESFVPDEIAGEAKKAEEERKQAERERERKKREQEAALEARRKAIAAGDEKAMVESSQETLEAAQFRREKPVYQRLIEGCENLYRRKPDETITNTLCFDVFLSSGLPD